MAGGGRRSLDCVPSGLTLAELVIGKGWEPARLCAEGAYRISADVIFLHLSEGYCNGNPTVSRG